LSELEVGYGIASFAFYDMTSPATKKRKRSKGNKTNQKEVGPIEPTPELPIHAVRGKLLGLVAKNPVTILVGETGSGKTTQLPQFLHDAGYNSICITQPRRVACISIATRVSDEMGTKVGGTVGYSIRFEDVTSKDTKIKFLTDGMLLRELLSDSIEV
jgi:HrpA-like RNA helicase